MAGIVQNPSVFFGDAHEIAQERAAEVERIAAVADDPDAEQQLAGRLVNQNASKQE